MKKLAVITIDFWNTLLSSSGSEKRQLLREIALAEVLKKENVSFNQSDFSNAFSKVLEHFKTVWFSEHRTMQTEEISIFLLEYFGCNPTKESISYLTEVFSNGVVQEPPELLPYVQESLEVLSKDFSLGIISDTYFSPGAQLREVLKHHSILHYFSTFSFSNETGVSKPNKKAFEVVFETLQKPIANSLHIGDIKKTDILGANSLQIDSVLYTGNPTPFTTSLDDTTIIPTYSCSSWKDIVDVIFANYTRI